MVLRRECVRAAGVDAGVEMAGQLAALADRLADEPDGPGRPAAISRSNSAPALSEIR